ncbi:fatty acid oxidation complex subunit alpha FadB [Motiliproteus sp. SC1-56]|uniref:fatty acid oxidation complex subunit alpha FadB n=1 Tax=Motiliproteus sp. SC1-56 TaxID=2799565 RepID=UPI001A8E25F1|nr:fatty acid oxidation complex subunit alpha FadB [Motiliproteus sp. SC1-56]
MIYQGNAIGVKALDEGLVELCFDVKGQPVNTLSQATVTELGEAVEALAAREGVRGLLISSAKDAFIVGADIKEFSDYFARDEAELVAMLQQVNTLFSRVEDLPFPTVAAINGLALGGGFELCLCADYRVMADSAKVGLPETKLGIYPGWGGTVRLPRLIGVDNAIEWIASGSEKRADKALFEGAADAVVPVERVREAALDLLAQCAAGKLDYASRRAEKKGPLKLGQLDTMMAFETAKGFVAGKAGPHYPAPVAAIKTMQKHAALERDAALAVEAKGFVKVAKSDVCRNLVALFLNDQLVKKTAQGFARDAAPVKRAAVLGAGIMGGGIAYQSASRGTPILMKDINEPALEAGMAEAATLLGKQVARGRLDNKGMAKGLAAIRPTLGYSDFAGVDLVVEAVVENPKVKQAVLAEVEGEVSEETVLTSNTSTISIDLLAEGLKRPENFCGMHFFNPVHRMPLVEVIRGAKSSERAVATTVAYAQKLGKTPIVVNDCPGFLVNRVLFPYFAGFDALLKDGVDYRRIDKVMEAFGWPMGPAYLLDVVGLDTAVHAESVMAEGYPDRMQPAAPAFIRALVEQGRLGQKSGEGFYCYEKDRKGKLQKRPNPAVEAQLAGDGIEISDEQIVARMMTPLCIETARCLEEGIVGSAAEADMGLVYGIGFPPFRGGALRYLDDLGLATFCQQADELSPLGPLYQPTKAMRALAAENRRYFEQ